MKNIEAIAKECYNRHHVRTLVMDAWNLMDCRHQAKMVATCQAFHSELMQPIPGPPDLEGVEGDYFYMLSFSGCGVILSRTANELRSRARHDLAAAWHIPLGVITPPEEETVECLCQWCGEGMKLKEGASPETQPVRWFFDCPKCHSVSPYYYTMEEAIAVAKGEE